MNEPSRTEKFAAQLAVKLTEFGTDAAKIKFLRALARSWEEKYDRWMARVDSGREEVVAGGPTAFDFASTIAEIHIAIGRIQKVAA